MKSTLPISSESGIVLPRLSNEVTHQFNAVDSLDKLYVCLHAMIQAQAIPTLETFLKPYLRANADDWQQSVMQIVVDFIDVVDRLPKEYRYHPYVDIFKGSCRRAKLQQLSEKWEKLKRECSLGSIIEWEARVFCIFTANLKHVFIQCQTPSVKTILNVIAYEATQRLNEYCKYTEALFATNDRLVVIRLDLFYRKNLLVLPSLHRLNDDLGHLFDNMRGNQLFNGVVGRIVKLEYGIEKGVHSHVTLFFNGSVCKPSSHIYLAQQIGEYWRDKVTNGDGDYWNCNKHSADFKSLGRCAVGLIHGSDEEGRRNVHEQIVKYACKTEQMIKVKTGDQIKTIKRGVMPEIPNVKLGRPRKQEWRPLPDYGVL
ncbi:hypothetical protein H8K32_16780 [Undibacterium jejuense]|uniref:Inovirus Gp2 family protein n=1 Tax=Undibacterium jejuense TaxID=1344949 RepID=A0A923HL84_9BURK|nr:hypothetical protein [Undibacterium jejuense]MBC3863762.1 hypothetical protein [Undibacterium jejuense]